METYRAVVSNLPPKFQDKGFLNYTPRNEWEEATKRGMIKFATNPQEKKSILLTGKTGTGKTHLAVAAMRNLCPMLRKMVISRVENQIKEAEVWQAQRAVFLTADEFFQKLNDRVNARISKIILIEDMIKNYDVILLDDLRAENFSEAKVENFYMFINHAYLHNKRLIITTNLTIDDISKIEPRVASRITEMSQIIKFEGMDYRIEEHLESY